ncbi:MAG: hypothetical protein IH987_12425 [Planctomycetes bacterium]|nr:hypothetical protein [Planctomycetota bacterium]
MNQKTKRPRRRSRLRWIAAATLAVILLAGGYCAYSIWSYWNPEGWSGEHAIRVTLIPPPGKEIISVGYYVDPTMYFGSKNDRKEFHRYGRVGYERRNPQLMRDGEFTIHVECGGLRWLHGDNGYNQRPSTILLMVLMNDGNFEHLLGLPNYYSEKRTIVLDLADPPDDLIAKREKRKQR